LMSLLVVICFKIRSIHVGFKGKQHGSQLLDMSVYTGYMNV